MAGTYSLKRFLEKTPGTEKHKDKLKKPNGVITLPWPDYKKFSSLYNTVVVIFFPYLYSCRRS